MLDEKTIKKELEKKEKSSVQLSITVEAGETRRFYDDLMTKYRQQAQIKGFRQGKVPLSLLERKFGEGIRQEAMGDLIKEAMAAALEGLKEQPLGYQYPEIKDSPVYTPGEEFSFVLTYDVFPEVPLGDFKKITVEEPRFKITSKDEAEEMKQLQERNALVVEKADGIIAKDSVVTMDYGEKNEAGGIAQDTQRKDFVFTLGSAPHPYGIDDEILGMKVEETKVIEKSYPQDYQPNAYLAGKTVSLEVVIKAVKERQLPDLDDEFAQDVGEELKTLKDLKEKIKTSLKERGEAKVKSLKIKKILETLEGEAKGGIDLPESMIQADLESTWKDYVQRSGAREDQLIKALEADNKSKETVLAGWQEDAEKSIRTQLILGKIAEKEKEKIEVTSQEWEKELQKRADEFKMNVEDLEKTFGGPQFRDYLKNELAQKKLYDFLLDNVEIKPGSNVNFRDLMDM